MNSINSQFSRFANTYDEFNTIQREVSKELINLINFKPQKILDLGSGTGEVIKNINWEFEEFIGIDISENMCKLHPKSEKIELLNMNFENSEIYTQNFDIIISASAIQWANNLTTLFFNISKATNKIAFAIFTSNTFKTLHKLAKINSPIYSKDELINSLNDYFNFELQTKNYELTFQNKIDIFKYIKKSGVSGGVKRLNYKDTKYLIQHYPLDYLEFEVIFIIGKTKN